MYRVVKKGVDKPPPFVSTLTLSHKFRYTNGSAIVALPVTRGNVLSSMLMAVTAGTAYRMIAAVKIVSVQAWAPPSTLPSTTELDLEWVGVNAPSTIISDSSMGVESAHIRTHPPRDSSATWWSLSGQSNETEQLMLLTAPVNSVFDVVMRLRLVENEAPSLSEAPALATPGKVYYDYLDGLTSGQLKPVGGLSVLP